LPSGARLAFLGTPAFAVPSLRRLVAAGHDVRLVVTQPDRPAGRGRAATAPPIKVEAERLGLRLLQPERLSAPEAVERLVASGAELGVVAAYGEVLSRDLLAALPGGFVNVHPSLLPRLRGATPIPTAILLGLERSGVTVMRVTPGVDAGRSWPRSASRSTTTTPARRWPGDWPSSARSCSSRRCRAGSTGGSRRGRRRAPGRPTPSSCAARTAGRTGRVRPSSCGAAAARSSPGPGCTRPGTAGC
jgi:hypothetical protein